MKAISAADAAKMSADAKRAAAAMAAEEAEKEKQNSELERIRALRERALSIALMRAAAEGKVDVIWNDDQPNLSQLGRLGLWVYEQGTFGWLDVLIRLREWHLYCLESVAEKWREDGVCELRITDPVALRKLFGGREGLSKLRDPFTTLLFDELRSESSPIRDLYVHVSSYQDEFEQLVRRCLQQALRAAVRDGDIDAELDHWTFWQYDEVYRGDFMRELSQESNRISSLLRSRLIDAGSPISCLDENEDVRMESISSLEFDPSTRRVAIRQENSVPIFQKVRIMGPADDRKFKGAILHPAITQYFSPRAGESNYKKIQDVKSLRISWACAPSTWRPQASVVDGLLLNWLGGSEGQRLFGHLFALIERGAVDGKSLVKLTLQQRPQFWQLRDDSGRVLASLPPLLLKMLLGSYGYIMEARTEGRIREITLKW